MWTSRCVPARALIQTTPAVGTDLHEVALEIGIATNHSTYDTLHLAFAIAMGATGVVVSDKNFVCNMRAHLDSVLAGMLVPLDEWAKSNGVAA